MQRLDLQIEQNGARYFGKNILHISLNVPCGKTKRREWE
jgi:hypothetical protein